MEMESIFMNVPGPPIIQFIAWTLVECSGWQKSKVDTKEKSWQGRMQKRSDEWTLLTKPRWIRED